MKIVSGLLMILAVNHVIACCWYGLGKWPLGDSIQGLCVLGFHVFYFFSWVLVSRCLGISGLIGDPCGGDPRGLPMGANGGEWTSRLPPLGSDWQLQTATQRGPPYQPYNWKVFGVIRFSLMKQLNDPIQNLTELPRSTHNSQQNHTRPQTLNPMAYGPLTLSPMGPWQEPPGP